MMDKSINIQHVTENRFDNKMWWVMDDGICFIRYCTEVEATLAALVLATANRQAQFVEDQMDLVQEAIIFKFGLSPDDASRAMQEWLT